MTWEANGTWTVKVSIPPGTYGYKFLVDGKDWVFDPRNSAPTTVNGIENSSITLTAESNVRANSTATPARAETLSSWSVMASPTVSYRAQKAR